MAELPSIDSPAHALRASGGGSGTAAGISFQARVGAWFASHLLSEHRLTAELGGGQVSLLRLETEAPLDDLLVKTETGWIYVQAKSTLSLSRNPKSELGKTIEQFVHQWIECSTGDGTRGWDRSLRREGDRFLLAVGPKAPRTITRHLKEGLAALGNVGSAPLPKAKKRAVEIFKTHLRQAWRSCADRDPSHEEIRSIANLVSIIKFRMDNSDRSVAETMLERTLDPASQPGQAFDLLTQHCQELMERRHGCDMGALRRALTEKGVRLRAPPSFQSDVERLIDFSERTQQGLRDYESIRIGDESIRVERICTRAVVDAARSAPVVLVGEPGAGKSALINVSAAVLKQEGFDVLVFAIDRLSANSQSGLDAELKIKHPLCEVLVNWPGDQPAFLFLDALDAARNGRTEAIFRTLIGDVLALDENRWRVIASIRTFDLQTGAQFRHLFKGVPPSEEFSDSAFPNVRHVHVPPWTSDELDQVIQRAPDLSAALEAGGERLRDLACVPFNTRLICELINKGLVPSTLRNVENQAQLLHLYWEHRIEPYRTVGELCLRDTVSKMVDLRVLRVRKLDVARMHATNAEMLDNFLHENVLISLGQRQIVQFRHHILFDYAASRVYLDLDDSIATFNLFRQKDGLGLMLAPAVSFSLTQLWGEGEDCRERFWFAIVRICGDSQCDPVARAVAARVATELPLATGQTAGLHEALLGVDQERGVNATRALGQVVSALVERLEMEDEDTETLDPWCELAEQVSERLDAWAWPLRALLFAIYKRADLVGNRALLGRAARALLAFCLEAQHADSLLSRAAIDFVAATYESDTEASRSLLSRLFEPARFRDHGDQDIPQLVRGVSSISRVDPDFVAEIYAVCFGGSVTDRAKTQLSDSQILALTSTRQQDYEHSWYLLGEFFREYITNHPLHAVRALILATLGHVQRKEEIDVSARSWVMSIPGGTICLQEDRSHIWAWNIDPRHGETPQEMIHSFVLHLETAEADVARPMIQEIIETNKLGVLWARTFLVSAKRPEELGHQVWAIATQEPFLTSWDTRKDAIDLIAARYPFESETSREAFERAALEYEFSYSEQPGIKQEILRRLFGCIGGQNLITSEARKFLPRIEGEPEASVENERPFRLETSSGTLEDRWQFSHPAANTEDPEVAGIRSEAEGIKARADELSSSGAEIEDITGAIKSIGLLLDRVTSDSNELPALIVDHAVGTLAESTVNLAKLVASQFVDDKLALESLIRLVVLLAALPVKAWNKEQEAQFEMHNGWGSPDAAVETAHALMVLSEINENCGAQVSSSIERFLSAPNPAARMQIAMRLRSLRETMPNRMWEWAERIASREENRGVLKYFAQAFLPIAFHIDVERAEQLAFILFRREFDREERETISILQHLGSEIAALSIYRNRAESLREINSWIAEPEAHYPELQSALRFIADALDQKYKKQDAESEAIAHRAQDVCHAAVEAIACQYEDYLEMVESGSSTETEHKGAQSCARLLDLVCGQIHLVAKSLPSNGARSSGYRANECKRLFFHEVKPTLERIADVGAPSTIYRLMGLLECLLPGNPAEAFDLVAHALLSGGVKHQYQHESLAADRFVKIMGYFLADHRELFESADRRQKLIQCLNIFSEVGWPGARRLLYRLSVLLH